ncbi:MAG TPA: 4-hydroxythreonine-4-phosphate dehydrogenase PdxA [Verrucomicrobia bacterium]|nr:MAG: 4-hydroxythreonine-4-phosphate dehydrogenase PdxA [Lentisphaerae bacterium GWF2_57_35]HBA85668.1 4-hydroxythreonine-4-phosphate dehydrogenase PdxA [Verrucomicrobiota bacterium]
MGAVMSRKIRLGITLGDVNGIGPEIALKAAFEHRWPAAWQLVLIGSASIVAEQALRLDFPAPPAWQPSQTRGRQPRVVCWDPAPALQPRLQPGRLAVDSARAADAWIRACAAACLKGDLDGMVTAPISKEAFHKAGIDVPGHTELLAELTHTRDFAMMLFGGPLRVVLATRHLPLARVASALNRTEILKVIRLTGQALPWLGCRKARIGVCGLNPHAGDGGALGHEEKDLIAPAIRTARQKGFQAEGPIPADAIFYQAVHGRYDAVIAMYHDQGLAPLKMIAFEQGVNVTLGLPIVRTSPDHGTAFDIAGKNKANPSSMIEAMQWAGRLAQRQNPWK